MNIMAKLIQIRLPDNLHTEAKSYAKQQELTMSELIRNSMVQMMIAAKKQEAQSDATD